MLSNGNYSASCEAQQHQQFSRSPTGESQGDDNANMVAKCCRRADVKLIFLNLFFFFFSVIAKPFPKEQGLRGWNSWFQASLQAKSQEAAEVSSCLWIATTMQGLSQFPICGFLTGEGNTMNSQPSCFSVCTNNQISDCSKAKSTFASWRRTNHSQYVLWKCIQNYITMHNNVRWCSVKSEGKMEVGVNGCVRQM